MSETTWQQPMLGSQKHPLIGDFSLAEKYIGCPDRVQMPPVYAEQGGVAVYLRAPVKS